MTIALVLWNGTVVGGAETFTTALAATLRRRGVEASVLFVGHPGEIGRRLDAMGVPHRSLGLTPGVRVLASPRAFARQLSTSGRDGAILVSAGYLAAAARIGGYRRRIVAVEHGSILQHGRLPWRMRAIRTLDRFTGVRAVDVQVAVSDFIRERVVRGPHARKLVTIRNGLDLAYFAPRPMPEEDLTTVACAARLIPGKGVDAAIRALANLDHETFRLRIAGTGPERDRLRRVADENNVGSNVEFVGVVSDMAGFWNSAHVAIVPSDSWIESFGLTACEAMACGRPVVATRNGALPEVVGVGTGTLVEPGDVAALAGAIRRYSDHDVCALEGAAARARCESAFDLVACADAYAALFD